MTWPLRRFQQCLCPFFVVKLLCFHASLLSYVFHASLALLYNRLEFPFHHVSEKHTRFIRPWLSNHTMSALYENLAGLHRRLQIINHHSTHQNDQFKLEDLEINPHGPKYICAECAWTTSKNAGALARHFTFKHASHRKCRDCTTVCEDQEELNEHRSQKHRHLCPRCQRMFATVQECGHHEPCDSQYRRAQEAENDAPSHRVVDQPIGGKAPASGQSLLDRRNSV